MSKLVLFIALATAATANAQTAALAGVVRDSAGQPVAGVEVTAVKLGRVVRTDSAGHFLITSLPAGAEAIRFRRLAFEPAILQIQLPPADTTEVEITLGVLATRLTAVLVDATAPQTAEIAGFELRRRRGIGHFITRADIERRHPMILSDMVRSIPGAILISGDNGRTAVRFSRTSRNCPPQFFIDGIQAMSFSIDDMMPTDVEGIEFYPGAAGVPPEFNRLHGTSICGTILIWSHVPAASHSKP